MKRTCPSCRATVGVVYMLVAHPISFEPREGGEDGERDRPAKMVLGPGVVDEGRPFGCRLCGGKRVEDGGQTTVVLLKLEDVARGAWPDLSERGRRVRIGKFLRGWRADSADGDRARAWLRELRIEAERQTKPPDEVWERKRDVYGRWIDAAIEKGILRTDEEGLIVPERQDIETAMRLHADELADAQGGPRARRDLLRWMASQYAMERGAREAGMSPGE